jgi:ketosteroid isomerase-like protein
MSLDDRLQQLESRLEHLENVEAIRALLSRYCKSLDERDAEVMTPLWSRDAVLIVRPWKLEFKGAKAVMDFYSEYFKGPWIEPRHNCANEHIERSGDGYKSFSYFHETLARDQLSVIGWGTWADQFVREDGVWKFARREINVMALAPISHGWAGPDKIMDL